MLAKFKFYKIFRFRHRYMMSRRGSVRLRYIMSGVMLFALALFALLSVPSVVDNTHYSVEKIAAITPASGDAYQAINTYNDTKSETVSVLDVAAHETSRFVALRKRFLKNTHDKGANHQHISESIRSAPAVIAKVKKPLKQTIKVGSGQTVAGILQDQDGLDGNDAYEIVKVIGKHYNLKNVRAGHSLHLGYKSKNGRVHDGYTDGDVILNEISMRLSPIKDIVVSRKDDGVFSAKVIEKKLYEKTYARYATIQTSLYGSAAKAGIPSEIVAKMIKIYSWDVDFQRDVRRGDTIEILYKAFETEDGEYTKYGDIEFANINLRGKERPSYQFKANGVIDYFKPNGHSMKKTLMRTPIDGARISSGYGMRRHPVLGYTKMHAGVDFAAPTGTPVYAAGNGVIERANRFSSYGNYVKIKHNSSLKTAYAHLHRFGKGIKAGKRVKQGQIIGYVGTTGRSTGPHLHYEVHVDDKKVSPNRVDLPIGERLRGKTLVSFKAHMRSLDKEFASLTKDVDVAKADVSIGNL